MHGIFPFGADDGFVAELAKRFEVIAPVAPGCDELEELDAIEDIHDLAIYYDDLAGALDLGGAPVVGHSYGGMVALELAAHFPRTYGPLVVVAPFGIWDESQPTLDLATVPAARMRSRLANGAEQETSQDEDPVEAALTQARAVTAALKFLWPFADQGIRKRIHRVTQDVLVVWGTEDEVNPPTYASVFTKELEHASLETLPGSHQLPYERPGELAELISAFLGSSR